MSSTATAKATRPVTGSGSPDKAAASLVNNFRLASVTQRLRYHIQPGTNGESKEFQICCISLAKGIDFAIANNEVPKKIEELPFLLKQLCRHKTDVYSKTAITVLMISVKHACQLGWFSDTQAQELTAIADELRNLFGSFGNTIPAIQTPGPTFSQIMERFYPFVKLGHVLVSLQVEAGYTMLAHDFHISKDMPHSLKDKIRLFVVQTDNTDTAACIINPPEVSFILNGKPVEKRANISMDSGPQLPTNVTVVLKYGTNLLQVMGNFKGPYIIIIAFTGVVLPPQKPVLKDYLQSGVVESNPDSDVIEGASRVSLSCPISRSRIKLPVKGQLCKHLQCFDFSNYVNINMRNPSWRCPHCNQPVCYPDIRLDQNMVKILKGAGSNAADVIINADGTWKVAKENDESEEPMRDVIIHDLEDPTSFLNSGPVVLDLTGDDDDAEMELVGDITRVEDRKPHLSDAHGQSNNENANKNASDDDYTSVFNISDVISLDQLVLDQLSALGNTVPQPPQALNTAQDPISVPVPLSHTSSPRDRTATTSTIFTPLNPSHRFSQVHASPVTPTGQYHGRTSNPRWNQTFQSQTPSVATVPQSRRLLVPVTSQSPVNTSPFVQSQHIPGVLTSQPNSQFIQSLNSNHVSSQRQHPSSPTVQSINRTSDYVSTQRQHPSGPTVQSVTRTSDLMDVDSSTPNTTNWRPRMRGSLLPGAYSPSLDHMIIRPTQQSQTSLHTSQPVQAPPIQTSQAQPPSSTAPPSFTRPCGPTGTWRT